MSELFQRISSFQNLWLAARRAARGKRRRPDVAAFLLDLEPQLLALEAELRAGEWRPGGYRTFRITEPKERLICAAPFRDRVVHQAVVQILEPRFERGFIHDSYACRKGKGTHAALRRVAAWARTWPWFLKVDVEKFFPSVDQTILLDLVGRRVRCPRTLDLLARILASWQSDEPPVRWFPGDDLLEPCRRCRGLPIGNLTSQFLANVYLDPVDHLVKDRLRIRGYARYCDDLVVLGPSAAALRPVRDVISAALARLRLIPHPRKTRIQPVAQGIPWVGFTVRTRELRLREDSLRRARRRFRCFTRRLAGGRTDSAKTAASVQAWRAHAAHAGAEALLDDLLPSVLPAQLPV